MKHHCLVRIYLLIIIALSFTLAHATVTVDSVHVSTSTCSGNGTAIVYARSTNSNAVFLFNITTGPVTYTRQNDSTFYNLYPGNYTGWVYDVNSFDSTIFTFSVIINTSVNDTAVITKALCPGSSVHVGNHNYTQPGNYIDTLITYTGCDSIIYTHLTIDTSTITLIKSPLGYCPPGPTVLTATGTSGPCQWLLDSLTGTLLGTDTFVIVNPTTPQGVILLAHDLYGCAREYQATVYQSAHSTSQSFNICPGESVLVGAHRYSHAGAYTDTLGNVNGCDSIIYTHINVNTPVAVITSSGNLTCHLSAITLTASGDDTYTWSTGSHAAGITAAPAQITTYAVTVSNAADAACSATASILVYPAANDSLRVITTICNGEHIVVGHSTYTQTGHYIDSFTSQYGCDSLIYTDLIVLPSPPVTINVNDTLLCLTGQVTLTANGAATYAWSNGSTLPGITVYPTQPTTYSVIVTDTTAYSCSAYLSVQLHPAGVDTVRTQLGFCQGNSTTVGNHIYTQTGNYTDTVISIYNCKSIVYTNLTVYPLPIVGLNTSDTTPCHTGAVTLTATGGGAYRWSSGESTAAITINPIQTTQYYVTVTSNDGCTALAHQTVYPASTDTSILISPASGGICPGDSMQLCAPPGLNTYLWNNGAQTQCITVNNSGTYSLIATNNTNCTLVSNTVHIQQYTTTQPVIIHTGSALQSATTYPIYQWYLNGNAILGATSQSVGSLSGGSYTLQVTDSNGCITTAAAYIITAINNITAAPQISVFPNPNNTNQWQVTVSPQLANAQCQVFDVDGKEVYTTHLTGTSNNIHTNLSAGTYIMRITNGEEVYNIKLVQF